MRSTILGTWLVVALCECSMVAAAEPATILYVDAAATGANDGSSWADAYDSLQDALAAAAQAPKPVEVRVAQGVYKPDRGTGITPGDRAATFQLLNGVTVKGGYPGATGPDARDIGLYETILSGDLAGDGDPDYSAFLDNSYHVVTASGVDLTAVIEGFTITGGSLAYDARIEPRPAPVGGEAILVEAASPAIRNCLVSGNYASVPCGVVLATGKSNPVVTNCTFLDEAAGGMSCEDNSNAVLTGCRFEGGRLGALAITGSSPTLTDCTFAGNGARAMIDAHDSNCILTNCVFTGSGAGGSEQGIDFLLGRFMLTDCTFTGLRRGAIDAWGDLTLVRCTFSDNGGFGQGSVQSITGQITALECTFTGNHGSRAGAISGGDMQVHDCQFIGNSGTMAGAISGWGDIVTVTGCVFSGNSAEWGVGAIDVHGGVARVSNCTFVGNRGRHDSLSLGYSLALPPKVTQCIIWDGPNAFSERTLIHPAAEVTHCDIQGGYPGQGNIDIDPCFVDPGFWDPNGTPDDANDDFWVAGDYHLRSQGGHWDRATESWVRDEVTSACIDAGDPNEPLGVEPFPNGGVINLGAYGGSAEASKSYFGEPVCETQLPGDINGDCKVDQTDLDILMAHWLMEIEGFVNNPPTVVLLSPQDGAEITNPAPILFQCAASDPDGTVIRVKYTLERRVGNGRTTMSTTITNPANNWDQEFGWTNIPEDGTYTAWVEVMDDEGAKTASPRITITLHPAK